MLSCLLHLIVTPYFLVFGLITNKKAQYIFGQFFWILGHIGRVLIIVEPCQSCIGEVSVFKDRLINQIRENTKSFQNRPTNEYI